MKRTIITAVISLMLSAALVSGIQDLSAFSFYVAVTFNVLAWAGLILGGVKGDAARNIMRHVWVSAITTTVHLAALIFSGHPLLAASSLVCTVLTIAIASQAKEKKPCEQ